MTFTAAFAENGSITAGPLSDGKIWSNITEHSRFYGEVMEATNNGADIAAYEPVPALPDYQAAIQAHIDETARSKQFNDGVTLASYKDSTNPLWSAQAAAFIAWRDQVWVYAYAQLASVQAGQRAQPSVDEFLAELPTIEWPT